MSISVPMATLTLLNELVLSGAKAAPAKDLEKLRKLLRALPGFKDFELAAKGETTVELSVPARNAWERDKLKALIDAEIPGWHVIENQSYGLPTTF